MLSTSRIITFSMFLAFVGMVASVIALQATMRLESDLTTFYAKQERAWKGTAQNAMLLQASGSTIPAASTLWGRLRPLE